MDIRPNPARAEAGIRLHFAGPEIASLAIFGVRGRMLRSLAERRLFAPGLHEIHWRGDA